jgi:hypothetical protein
VPCRQSSCSAHPRLDDSTCLQSPTSPLPRIPQFHRRSRDGAVIGQSCLHSLAKIVVERQSQPTVPLYQRLNQGKSQESLVGGPSCQQQRTVLRILVQPSIIRPILLICHKSPDRAPSKVTRSVCLQSLTSPCPLVPSFLTGGVSYSVLQDA